MPVNPADSVLYGAMFGDREVARLFSDSAEIRAMLLVEGALAEAQAEAGIIPADSAAFIARAAQEVQIDPAALAEATAQNGVPVPALVAAFRKAMNGPEHAQYLHWGATTQDIMDTGLALRLRPFLALAEARLKAVLQALAAQAGAHADLPMAARTYGQAATPTSFGAVAAGWGRPLLRQLGRLAPLRRDVLQVSLGGAAGTLSAMGDAGPGVRAGVARRLGLADPGASWHPERDGIAALAGWITTSATALGKMAEDVMLMAQSGVAEVALASSGGSSTMPQKMNPVAPSVMVALARQVVALNGAIQGAALHRQQRDGAAWFVEWQALGQMCVALGRSLALAQELATGLAPQPEAMARGLDDNAAAGAPGLVHAEALTFALAARMPRPEAQAAVTELCRAVRAQNIPLADLAAARWPDTDWRAVLTAAAQLGTAPQDARDFAAAVARMAAESG